MTWLYQSTCAWNATVVAGDQDGDEPLPRTAGEKK